LVRVEQHIIKSSNENYQQIDHLTFLSKNLYNYALFKQRSYYEETGKMLQYKDLERILRVDECHETYHSLPGNTSQQILMLLVQNYKSYFKALKAWKRDKTKFKGCPKLPRFKHKTEGRNIIVFTTQQAKHKGSFITFPRKSQLLPVNTKTDNLKQVRIIPRKGYYVLEVVYNVDDVDLVEDNGNYASIDLGINNLCTVTSNVTKSMIINGKPLKSINKKYNKDKAQIQSKLEKNNHKKWSKRLSILSRKRSNRVNNYLHKTSRSVITFCESNDISRLAIGYNKNWKQNLNMGKRNNQTFQDIPFDRLVQMIVYKANEVGIKVTTINEAYTSKCSALDLETIEYHDSYMGNRSKRGLFKTAAGLNLNADVNGSLNIGRKVFGDEFVPSDRGLVVNPSLINLT